MPAIGLLILCFILLGAVPAKAEGSLIDTRLASTLQVETPQFTLGRPQDTFEQAHAENRPWQPMTRATLGYQPDGAWIRFSLSNRDTVKATWYLLLKWPVLDHVTLRVYYPERQRWSEPMAAGGRVPMKQQPLMSNNLVFPLDLRPGEDAVVYLHIEALQLIVLPLVLADTAGFNDDRVLDTAIFSLFYGGMLVIVLYNLSLMIFTRDPSYLLYVMYLFSAMFYITVISGLGHLLLWPGANLFSARFYPLSAALCFLTPLLFAYRFLEIRLAGGWIWHVTVGFGVYWSLVCLVALLAPAQIHWMFMDYVALPYCLVSLTITLTLWARGVVSARLFSIAWISLLGFTMIHVLALWGYMPLNRLTLNGQLIGMFSEFVLLSMALAERINLERNKRIAAQRTALLASQRLAEERQQHLHEQRLANEALETHVATRTQALEEARLSLEQANAELVRLSGTDSLTQLANRRRFDHRFEEEHRRAKRGSTPLSVLLCDLDHFKAVNDQHGHPFGDECLRQTAAVLQRCCQRAGEVAARYGGEEFVILLPDLDEEQARAVAERIRRDIERLVLKADGKPVALTISIGLSTLSPKDVKVTPMDLLSRADEALYEAKRRGRNRVVVARPPSAELTAPI